MAPEGRVLTPPETHDGTDSHPPTKAAVLILLYPFGSNSALHLPLIRRPDEDPLHPGQIALPGGRHKEGESFPVETALRESQEELSIEPESVRVIGELSPLYVGVSSAMVTPVIGRTDRRPSMRADPREVVAFFSISVSSLLSQVPRFGYFESQGGDIRAPYYLSEAGRIWGATAMILAELLELFHQAPK